MVKLSIDTKNLTVNLIDDSESTPGISRQITFFKSYLLRIMQMQKRKILLPKTIVLRVNLCMI
jgi:hypothetical protein